MMICLTHVLNDLAGVSSSGRLHRRTLLGTLCLKIAGSDRIWSRVPMFFLAVWFQRERGEALLSVSIIRLVLQSMVKLETENDMEAKLSRTSSSSSSL
jgi:hypothetical protein